MRRTAENDEWLYLPVLDFFVNYKYFCSFFVVFVVLYRLSFLLVYFTGFFCVSTDSLLCGMLVTFGSFVCYNK